MLAATAFAAVGEKVFYQFDGLYDGGDTICDGFSIYPYNAQGNTPLKGDCNFIHYKALLTMADIAECLGKPPSEADAYRMQAYALKDAINRNLWLPGRGFFSLLKEGRESIPLERSSLGELRGEADVYFNGIKLTKEKARFDRYRVPASALRFNQNSVIAVRVEDASRRSGFTGWPMELKILSRQ